MSTRSFTIDSYSGCACSLHKQLQKRRETRKRQKGISGELQAYLYPDRQRKKRFIDIVLDDYSKSYKGRLGKYRQKVLSRKPRRGKKTRRRHFLNTLLESPYFQQTRMEWMEAATILMDQAANLLRRILYVKKLSFIRIDEYFNIVHKREITTKERKRSRFGPSVSLTCEILKILKYVSNVHRAAQNGEISCADLCTTLRHIFRNVGTLTGIYRHKYKINRQIAACKSFKTYKTVWHPYWRIWCSMIRGSIPLLERYVGGLLSRMLNGRVERPQKETKQRAESGMDLRIKDMIRKEYGNSKRLLQHFNEMWRCWKADIPYEPTLINSSDDSLKAIEIRQILEPFKEIKVNWYMQQASSKKVRGRKEIKKQQGKILRLYMKNERFRQQTYLSGPFIRIDTAINIYKSMAKYLSDYYRVGTPTLQNLRLFTKILKSANKLSKDKDPGEHMDPVTCFNGVRRALLVKRGFKPLTIKYNSWKSLVPSTSSPSPLYYSIDFSERLVDAFLEEYLWESCKIFPGYLTQPWSHPLEAAAFLSSGVLENASTVYHLKYEDLSGNVDFNVLRSLLRLIVSPALLDYIMARINCRIEYKDMSVTNVVGLVHDIPFSSFLYTFWILSLNLCFLSDVNILLQCNTEIFITIPENAHIATIISRIPGGIGRLAYVNTIKIPVRLNLGGFVITQIGPMSNIANDKAALRHRQRHSKAELLINSTLFRVCADDESVKLFKKRSKYLRRRAVGDTFLSVVNKWNSLIKEYVGYYRETARIKEARECELAIKRTIMGGINSKMPTRYPLGLFHAPRRLGGLGMIGLGNSKSSKTFRDIFLKWHKEQCLANPLQMLEHSMVQGTSLYTFKKKIGFTGEKTQRIRIVDDLRRKYVFTPYDASAVLQATELSRTTLFKSLRILDENDIGSLWEQARFNGGTRAQRLKRFIIPNRRFVLWWSPAINRSSVYMGYKQRIDLTGVDMYGKLCGLKLLFVQIFREGLWSKIYARLQEILARAFPGFRAVILSRSKKEAHRSNGNTDVRIEGEFECWHMAANEEGIIYVKEMCSMPDTENMQFVSQENIRHINKINVRAASCRNIEPVKKAEAQNVLDIKLNVVWGNMDTFDLDLCASEYYDKYCDPSKNPNKNASLAILVDICYGKWSLRGCCNDRIFSSISSMLKSFLEFDPLMQILRERLRSALSIRFRQIDLLDVEVYACGYVCEVAEGTIHVLNTKTGHIYIHNVDITPKNIIDVLLNMGIRTVAVSSVLGLRSEQIEIRTFKESFNLHNFAKYCVDGFPKAVQYVYFKGATSYTSFCRLRILLKSGPDKNTSKIRYNGDWSNLSAVEWATLEQGLKHGRTGPNTSVGDTESTWTDDYTESNGVIKQGRLMECIGEGESRVNRHGMVMDMFGNVEGMPAQTANRNMPIEPEGEAHELRIPKNIIRQFRMLSNTNTPVRAYIKSITPFTVVITPQYLNTTAAFPEYIGIISNTDHAFKSSLEIIISDKLVVRGWRNTAYIPLSFCLVESHGIFQVSDWNFNFRIPEFKRTYSLVECTPGLYYDRSFREKHFKEYKDSDN